ncbi:MAG TPA: Hpt domain-containing protein [Candidatus Binatia bacterium]|nr:Hpt domain-containing protein [Candidatus Binatia bacterium]
MAPAEKFPWSPASAAEPAIAEGEVPILDRQAMLATVEQDLGLLRELVEIFLSASAAQLAELRAGIRERDADAAERAAHTLRSAVLNFGGLRVAQAARAVEVAARANRLDQARRLLPQLEAEIAQVCQALSRFLSEVAG